MLTFGLLPLLRKFWRADGSGPYRKSGQHTAEVENRIVDIPAEEVISMTGDENEGAAGGGGGAAQDLGVAWEPAEANLGELAGFVGVGLTGITSLTFSMATCSGGFAIRDSADIESIEFTALTEITGATGYGPSLNIQGNAALASLSVDLLETTTGSIDLRNNASLATVEFPVLVSTDTLSIVNLAVTSLAFPLLESASFSINDNTSLASLSCPEFVGHEDGVYVSNNTALTSVSLPSFLPVNETDVYFDGNALDATSVNHILARCVANAGYVSGTVDLSGGTSAAPSGQGATDKTTLQGRGVTVNTN